MNIVINMEEPSERCCSADANQTLVFAMMRETEMRNRRAGEDQGPKCET